MIMPKTVPEVLLYGTLGCHLCDDAMKLGLEALPKDVLIKLKACKHVRGNSTYVLHME